MDRAARFESRHRDAIFGSFDHIVTTAGAGVHGSIRDLTSADARPILDTKFWGYYDAVRAAAKTIAVDGSITLLGGGASRKYCSGIAAMAGINAAVEAFGKAAAVELAPSGSTSSLPD